ncbi:hypothetical protein T07_3173 [Trichinella nelsoni]|uniref:Uncharacterized protein n=1 Tax=Trichinella nelsoni TaxID=6336 RepID=A0A0V0SAU9_9BILA|nr:hypothetical protein T07_3173 [Trichinella nelsoni]
MAKHQEISFAPRWKERLIATVKLWNLAYTLPTQLRIPMQKFCCLSIAAVKFRSVEYRNHVYKRSTPKRHHIPTPFLGRVTTPLPVGTEPIMVVELTESIENLGRKLQRNVKKSSSRCKEKL